MMNAFEGHGWGMGWGMGWWWIIGLIIVVAVVWMVVKSMNANSRGNLPSGKSALEILKERYAQGGIDKEEFEERKKDLM
ncbi:MAG: SHOCT domain-containing protein [Chitinophagales bacterium]|jgi:putative membrane protein|nr:SHOCT domain-containing protein [Chitinophagales bacterium]